MYESKLLNEFTIFRTKVLIFLGAQILPLQTKTNYQYIKKIKRLII